MRRATGNEHAPATTGAVNAICSRLLTFGRSGLWAALWDTTGHQLRLASAANTLPFFCRLATDHTGTSPRRARNPGRTSSRSRGFCTACRPLGLPSASSSCTGARARHSRGTKEMTRPCLIYLHAISLVPVIAHATLASASSSCTGKEHAHRHLIAHSPMPHHTHHAHPNICGRPLLHPLCTVAMDSNSVAAASLVSTWLSLVPRRHVTFIAAKEAAAAAAAAKKGK